MLMYWYSRLSVFNYFLALMMFSEEDAKMLPNNVELNNFKDNAMATHVLQNPDALAQTFQIKMIGDDPNKLYYVHILEVEKGFPKIIKITSSKYA
ncbi:hypothetical protein HZS_5372 [Henneguya salminicola]|nr:hypothetical protein HZS_5372 [Henneguya salminicola]